MGEWAEPSHDYIYHSRQAGRSEQLPPLTPPTVGSVLLSWSIWVRVAGLLLPQGSRGPLGGGKGGGFAGGHLDQMPEPNSSPLFSSRASMKVETSIRLGETQELNLALNR